MGNMSFEGKVSPQMKTNPPPSFHSTSNPHTMQAKDCGWMCTQVMQANKEETLRPTSVSAHLYGFLSPCCARKQCTTNSEAIKSIPGTPQILSPAGFDLILLIRDCGLNHIAGVRQAHTWGGWVAFLRTEWCVLRLKDGFLSTAGLC